MASLTEVTSPGQLDDPPDDPCDLDVLNDHGDIHDLVHVGDPDRSDDAAELDGREGLRERRQLQ